jgi:Ca2+-binding RTX toxin-like protein
VFGQSGNDRLIWNPGDDTDLNEGGDGTDTVEVNGGNGSERFTATANGTRVRFDRLDPAPFTIDIGTSENLTLNANGGDDTFTGSNGLAPLIQLVVDGGTGNDTLTGGDGTDLLLGGDGNDLVIGGRGNDTALLGAGDDNFVWNPGDGSDIEEGQDGADTMTFNGANIAEKMDVSANGRRVRFTRDVASIVMDLNGVESIVANTLGGADTFTVNDLSGTDVTSVLDNGAAAGGADDGAADTVVANATAGDDIASVAGAGTQAQVSGLAARVAVTGAGIGDRLTVATGAGDDVLDGSLMTSGPLTMVLDGGDGDDVLLGGPGADILLGGAGDDVLIGGGGQDVLDGGPGGNVVINAFAAARVTAATPATKGWLKRHLRSRHGRAVVRLHGKSRVLPRASLRRILSV